MVKSIQIYYVILTIVINEINFTGLFTHLCWLDSYGLEFLWLRKHHSAEGFLVSTHHEAPASFHLWNLCWRMSLGQPDPSEIHDDGSRYYIHYIPDSVYLHHAFDQ